MDRRSLFAALACWPAASLFAQDESPRPRHKISAAALHGALAARFPLRLGVPGLLAVEVDAPRLLLLPPRNKMGAALRAQVSGPGLAGVAPGELDLVFAVRYEPADRSLRAHQPEVLQLRLPGAAPELAEALQRLLPQLVRESMREFVLHRFTARELALPETMGFEPDTVTVLDDGVLLLFKPKPRG